ncbi:MAG: FG-GAP-like repeat-containing protein [Pseudomonadota bacterium]
MRLQLLSALFLAAVAVSGAGAGQLTEEQINERLKDAEPLPLHVTSAELITPTGRYGHRVLGAEGEYAALRVGLRERYCPKCSSTGLQSEVVIELPEDRVFEDVETRLADLNGDGFAEIIVVESSAGGGAELAVYGVVDDAVGKIAATPPIGRRNRWLAPAGIADFNGDGQNDIAYVEKPHIGGDLYLWTMRDGQLVEFARKGGFSNHKIGEDFITGDVRDCGDGPEAVLPNFNWSKLMAVRFDGAGWDVRPIADETDAATVDAALACGN